MNEMRLSVVVANRYPFFLRVTFSRNSL